MQIRRGREADTERLVALAGQIFETEQEIPRALTPLPPENRPQWWCVEEDGALLGGVGLYHASAGILPEPVSIRNALFSAGGFLAGVFLFSPLL